MEGPTAPAPSGTNAPVTGPPAASPPLRFSLTIVDGRARLTGSPGVVPGGLGRLERLELEVPGLRFPFDLSQGARVFQSRRCHLVEFAYSIGAADLEAAFARGNLGRFGLSDPAVLILEGGLRLGLRVAVAGREAELSAKITITAGSGGFWRITIRDARVHGFVPVPAPLLLSALPAALGFAAAAGRGADLGVPGHWAARAPALFRARGLTEVDVDVAGLVLVSVLAGAGYRLPSLEGLSSLDADFAGGRVHFALGAPTDTSVTAELPAVPGDVDEGLDDERGLAALAEASLFSGEVRPATEGFRRALVVDANNEFARERLIQLLAASPGSRRELGERSEAWLDGQPDFALALVGKAIAAAESGAPGEAARLFTEVAALAQAAGEILDEVAARVAAAEQWSRAGDGEAARQALQRALSLRPQHGAAGRALDAVTRAASGSAPG